MRNLCTRGLILFIEDDLRSHQSPWHTLMSPCSDWPPKLRFTVPTETAAHAASQSYLRQKHRNRRISLHSATSHSRPTSLQRFSPLVRHDPTSCEPRLRREPHSRRLVVVYHIWTHGIDAASPPTTVSSFRSSISLLVPFPFLFIISRLVTT